MPCKKKRSRKRRTRNPTNQYMRMTTDVAKIGIGAATTAFVVTKVTDALKT